MILIPKYSNKLTKHFLHLVGLNAEPNGDGYEVTLEKRFADILLKQDLLENLTTKG